MLNWDYDLPKNWKPKTDEEWEWYLTRVINYGPDKADRLDKRTVKKYLPKIERFIDPAKRMMLRDYLDNV